MPQQPAGLHAVGAGGAGRLRRPLGNPQPNSVKYFATVEVLEHAKDRTWLAKVTNAVSQHWKQKNQHKKGVPAIDEEYSPRIETGLVSSGSETE